MSLDTEQAEKIISWHLTPEEIADMRKDLLEIRDTAQRTFDRAERLLNLYAQDGAYQALFAANEKLRQQLEEARK